MFYWLYEHREFFSSEDGVLYKVLNIFKYHTFRAGGAALTAFAISMLFGERLIRKLISLKIGQPIRTADEVNKLYELHGKKAGTPTMGGILILGSVVFATLLWARPNPVILTILFTTVGLGLLGFYDDYLKISKKNSKGISARLKLAWQGGVALIAAIAFSYWMGDASTVYREFHLPFYKDPVITDLGIFTIPLFVIIIIGASNAVNLTDGLDGLATGCTLTTTLAYAAFGYVCGSMRYATYLDVPHIGMAAEMPIVAMALAGACLGFLWFNAHPARMFMGDTGSLAIGGCVATLAISCKQEIVLVIVGGVFVMEAMSVILQVASFKLRGKRIFRMSPIHHHFELGGWHENQVIVRFWILSIAFAMLGLASLKIR
jgi:phospho-N-acetylmuramoyl-pentapeptide-transferase